MKILIPVLRVPDPFRPVLLTPEGRIAPFVTHGTLNPTDETALEEALHLCENGLASDVVAVGIGGSEYEDVLLAARACGSGRAVLVQHEGPIDAGLAAWALAGIVRREQPDLILMGRASSETGSGETGPRLAALLGWPQATFAVQMAFSGTGQVRVMRATDAGMETVEVTLPAVVTVDPRLNQPRLPSLYAIVAAQARPCETVPINTLGTVPAVRVTTERYAMTPPRPPGRLVGSVDELIDALRHEARIIP